MYHIRVILSDVPDVKASTSSILYSLLVHI